MEKPPPEGAFPIRKLLSAAVAGLLVAAAAVTGTTAASATPPVGKADEHSIKVCSDPRPGEAACAARQATDPAGRVITNAANAPATALTPTDLRSAYNLGGTASGGKTVAIVDAYGYPNLERDLAAYRTYFGLPACTTANGCLTVLDQNGGNRLPRFDLGWAQEQALDVDAVSAACPDCKITVVQAASASFANLGTAVQTAARQPGVVAISNSYGGSDVSDASYGQYYNFPGIAVTASAGDNGYQGASYPASSSYVTAVGGTSLNKTPSPGRAWSETVWSGTGSGCSAYNAPLSAAATYGTGCSKRAMNDVAAVSDPSNGGLAVFYPTSSKSSTWGQFGGTSEASPIIASVYALAGHTGPGSSTYANSTPYAHQGSLFDIDSGSNGTCSTAQWCSARTGWDGPTGLGTPNGIGAF